MSGFEYRRIYRLEVDGVGVLNMDSLMDARAKIMSLQPDTPFIEAGLEAGHTLLQDIKEPFVPDNKILIVYGMGVVLDPTLGTREWRLVVKDEKTYSAQPQTN